MGPDRTELRTRFCYILLQHAIPNLTQYGLRGRLRSFIEGVAQSVDDLLTTRQLQELLQVDRITIYRMLKDGRLHGFKVGGQWRFSRREIEAWLQGQQSSQDSSRAHLRLAEDLKPSTETLPLSCVQAIQGVCAEALGVAAVTTGLDGVPLTGVSNSCDYCTLILSTHEGRRRCGEAWLRALGGELHPCHAGLLCASATIEIHASRVAIVSSCQFVAQPPTQPTQPGQAWQTRVSTLAEELGLADMELRATMDSVRGVTEGTLGRIPTLVQRMADTFSEIGEERLALLGRLQHISEMSRI